MDDATIAKLRLGLLRDFAEETARKAGELLKEARGRANENVDEKKNIHDIVTQADKDSEALVVEAINGQRTEDGIVGEEGFSKPTQNGIVWYIDPCDGTRNFANGGSGTFAVSLGVEIDGVPSVGVVLDVQTGTLYKAANGLGAYRDMQEISASKATTIQTATVGFDGAMDFATKLHQQKVVGALWPKIGDIRRIGCTSIDYCRVAEGTFDGAFGHGNGPWDIAAGRVIAQEAGARVGNIPLSRALDKGNSLCEANLVAAPGVFDELKTIISSVGQYSR